MFFCFCFFKIIFKVLCQLLDLSWLPYWFFWWKDTDCPPLIEQLKHELSLEKIYISTSYSSPVMVASIFHIDECLWSALCLWITPKTLLKIPSPPASCWIQIEFNSIWIQIEFNSIWIQIEHIWGVAPVLLMFVAGVSHPGISSGCSLKKPRSTVLCWI